jgi:ankyrin repeat protein
MSAALQALYEGDADRARELLPADEELTVFEAAAFGRTERLVELLVADPSQATALSEDGFTALHLAIFGGQEGAARLLIEHGSDVNRVSTGFVQVPPLGTAVFVRSLPLVRLLLDSGADVNGGEANGFTPLHAAAENGDLKLARELLARGADPRRRTSDGKVAADLAADDELRALLAVPVSPQ